MGELHSGLLLVEIGSTADHFAAKAEHIVRNNKWSSYQVKSEMMHRRAAVEYNPPNVLNALQARRQFGSGCLNVI